MKSRAAPAGKTVPPQPAQPAPLYESRRKIYPKRVSGFYRNIKWAVMIVTLGIYYFLPWLRWDRGLGAPDQAVLLDIPNRRFYFFMIEIWPQEIYFLTGLLILAALVLFLVTALFGRVWCGYACPQTVWTDLFIWVERIVQGDRNKRMKLDRSRWTAEKIVKKSLTHAIWLFIAVATGGAWVFYYGDAPTLARDLLIGEGPTAAYVAIAAFTFTTYSLGGLMREQVCTYMCPWPRIQGAMFDEHTFLVSYKADRGEPRGPHKHGESWEGRGDCVDCHACVNVCPAGIDIRDGPQLECIQCALCIDACDEIMDKVGRPRGLIDYETIDRPRARAAGEPERTAFLRPRILIYLALIGLVCAIMAAGLLTRSDLEFHVEADRNPLFVRLSDGAIRNGYSLNVVNKEHEERRFAIVLDGLAQASIARPLAVDLPDREIAVPASATRSFKIYVTLEPAQLDDPAFADGAQDFAVTLQEEGSRIAASEQAVFRSPVR